MDDIEKDLFRRTQRRARYAVAGLVLFALAVFTYGACTPRQAARTAIDLALAACIAEHAEIQDEKELKAICQWADELAPIVKDLLAARKKGLQRASKAGACGPDGGQ